MHEKFWIGIECFDAVGAAELHLLTFVNFGVGFFGFAEWSVDD
jgi:hypothetical protein